jgi:hypothetical protein
MTIASEITDLHTNLTAAKNAVTAKGGTVGDTGLAGLAAEITTIPAGGGGNEPGGEARISGYDTTTGIISGSAFGSTAGTVYMLDRDTHTYVSQPTSSWSSTSITLTTPIDLSTLEGNTSIVVVTNDGEWSTKWIVTGQVAVTGYVKAYVKNSDTGVVRTVNVSSSEWSQFAVSSNAFSKQITADGDTFYSDEVVGIQFGSSFSATSFSTRTFAYFVNLNQPITIPNTVTSIGNYFLNYCVSFNQPITIPSGITSIGTNSFNNCFSFNQPLTIPSSMTSIGSSFFNNCYSFNQPLTIPSGITSIGTNFFNSCVSFNQPIIIPNTVTSISDSFLRNCSSFNQPITIPNATSIGTYFLSSCYSFNQPLTIPKVASIGSNFLSACYSFNQLLTIPNTVTSISDSFLRECYSFNQLLTIPNTVTSIGTYFLANCFSFNQPLTISSSVTSIGTYFLSSCHSFSALTANTTTSPTDNNSLSTNFNTTKMYVKGITVTGTGASTWVTNLPNRTSSPFRKLIDGTA